MKIVVPTCNKNGLDAEISEHLGRSNTFTFLNEKGEVLKIIDNISDHFGGTGTPPELIKKHGADILLCKGLGPRAFDLCKSQGIEIYVCQGAQTVKEIFNKWNTKKIKKADSQDICHEHKH